MGIIAEYRDVDIERNGKSVLKGVDFTLHPGEFHYLVGKVGSGKSSLMKTMYADVPVVRGEKAEVLDTDLLTIKHKDIAFLRRRLGIVFQDFQLLQDRTVGGNLKFVLKATGWNDDAEMEQRMAEVLNAVGMGNKSYKMPHELSGGEQQRIAIARALLNSPALIIADEPTGNLDPATGYQIIALLHDLADAGHCVLTATHNLQLTDDFPGHLMRCENKQLRIEK